MALIESSSARSAKNVAPPRARRTPVAAALADFAEGVGNWPLWSLLAWQDIKQRYRRSTLGPFWLTLSMGVTMLVMGVIMGILLNSGFAKMLPYVCTGLIGWTLITQTLNEGACTFYESAGLMLQIKKPLTMHLMRMLWRNLIIFAHNMVIFVVIALIYRLKLGFVTLLFIPALLLIMINLAWISLVIGMVSARFRDLPMIVQSLFQMLFWFTPILYAPENLGDKAFLVAFNPFTYLMELFRAPLLGQAPSAHAWLIGAAAAVIGWTAAFVFFVRFRPRLTYWM